MLTAAAVALCAVLVGHVQSTDLDCKTGSYKLIPKDDCRGYYLCVFGRAVEMPDCPPGSVFSSTAHVCVPENSLYNDCKTRLQPPAPGPVDLGPMDRPRLPDLGPLSIEEKCSMYGGIHEHPTECQAYYNCSHTQSQPFPRYHTKYMQECKYPLLFNPDTKSCEDFEKVKCGNRQEFTNACDYKRYQCPSAHCMPCSVRFPSCEGKPDGIEVHEEKLWSPYYVVCYKSRTMSEETCPKDVEGRTQLFHPEIRECVSLDKIPKERGGMMPDCLGKPDGFYLDDFGRCNQYTVCKDGKFLNNVKCMSGEVFDVNMEVCIKAEKACGPCGKRTDC